MAKKATVTMAINGNVVGNLDVENVLISFSHHDNTATGKREESATVRILYHDGATQVFDVPAGTIRDFNKYGTELARL